MSAAGQQPASQLFASSISRYFEISLYLLVLTGFVTLASTGELDIGSTVFVAAALLLRGYVLATGSTLLIPLNWTNALTLAYVGFYVIDYLLLSQQFVTSTVHLVLFLTVVRLFSSRRDRDHYFLAIIAFLMVLASAVLTVESTFFFAFTAFMLFAIASFILMEMKRTGAQATASAQELRSGNNRGLVLSVAGVTPAILLLILIAGTIIFFILPRLSSGYLSAFSRTGGLSTGFSDHVELGSIGEIQQSNSVVMHIEITGDQRGGYAQKWRGITLSLFDGTSWSNPYRPYPIRPGFNQQFDLRPRNTRFSSPPLWGMNQIHYHILMEPVGINVFFLAPEPFALRGKYRAIAVDRGGAVFNLDADHPIGVYDGWSLRDTQTAAGQEMSYTPEELADYLQLPRLDARIPQLAAQVAGRYPADYEKATAIDNYLRSNFSYTLQLPSTRPADPLAYFLFQRKQGHCEYFASAMAVMLRTLKIPSRVVTGFKTDEFNDVTSQYVVRASDAHAWVEAYFPGRGWVAFDPTPPSNAYAHASWGRLSMYTDAMASFWREWIVNYDVAHQYSLGQQTLYSSQRWLRRTQHWSRMHYRKLLERARLLAYTISLSPAKWALGIFGVIALVFLVSNLRTLGRALLRVRLSRHPDRFPRIAASLWYEKMLRKVGKKGLRKSGTQTPVEFADSIQNGRLKQKVLQFTYGYEAARFGNSAEDARTLPDLYKEVVETLP